MQRNTVNLLVAAIIINAGVSVRDGIHDFTDPSRAVITHRKFWYEDLIDVGAFAAAAALLIAYAHRRGLLRSDHSAPSVQEPWRHQWELRAILYLFVAVQFLRLPVGAWDTMKAMHSWPPPWHNTFWSLYPTENFIWAAVAVAVMVYDRRRLRREARNDRRHCATCGYDLRATPHRCPECGTVPAGSKMPA